MCHYEQNVFVKMLRGMAIVGVMLFQCITASAAVRFVDVDNSSGAADGNSWATAFTTLQAGVDAASSGDEVWVAEGTYTGTGDHVVALKEGVTLYGGFVGTETLLEERNWSTHVTVIDGENARRGVYYTSSMTATLDGFTVTRGYVLGEGGGMHYGTAINCMFYNNRAH